ncbi:hypothetical protein BB560_003161 [Smittium megazygosporum]|uniref:Chitinase n=1 Tax=Smittium megazygosporum TaxID=133381 RepID=A0A2T9ZCS0_9FUNG|nr:hypothetical protein BB560_003161 [Smittium megazygosporum]
MDNLSLGVLETSREIGTVKESLFFGDLGYYIYSSIGDELQSIKELLETIKKKDPTKKTSLFIQAYLDTFEKLNLANISNSTDKIFIYPNKNNLKNISDIIFPLSLSPDHKGGFLGIIDKAIEDGVPPEKLFLRVPIDFKYFNLTKAQDGPSGELSVDKNILSSYNLTKGEYIHIPGSDVDEAMYDKGMKVFYDQANHIPFRYDEFNKSILIYYDDTTVRYIMDRIGRKNLGGILFYNYKSSDIYQKRTIYKFVKQKHETCIKKRTEAEKEIEFIDVKHL